NDLLNEGHVIGKAAETGGGYHSFTNGTHLLNRQYSFPCDIGMSRDVACSVSSSCKFERTRSYNNGGFQRVYSSSGSNFETFREFIPQASPLPYGNGHIDGLIPNQWQMAGSDLSLLGTRNAGSDGSPYFNPEYSNLACGVDGYMVFRPSN